MHLEDAKKLMNTSEHCLNVRPHGASVTPLRKAVKVMKVIDDMV